jgi:Flp pilus assembly protein CpaB
VNPRARTGIILAAIGILLALSGIFVINSIVRRSLSPLPAATQPPSITEAVVVTTHDIPLGTVLKPADLTTIDLPVGFAPAQALRSVETATGRITTIQLVGGEMVIPQHLADPTNVQHDLALVIEDSQVLMAFPATDLMSSLNILQRGDLVDILASIEEPVQPQQAGVNPQTGETNQPEDTLFTFDALQRVQISAMIVEIVPSRNTGSAVSSGSGNLIAAEGGTPQPTSTPNPSQVQAKSVLLALSPQDALVLKHLKDAGATFDIVLRAPSSSQLFEAQPVSPQYLMDRYELQVSK